VLPKFLFENSVAIFAADDGLLITSISTTLWHKIKWIKGLLSIAVSSHTTVLGQIKVPSLALLIILHKILKTLILLNLSLSLMTKSLKEWAYIKIQYSTTQKKIKCGLTFSSCRFADLFFFSAASSSKACITL